jgi:hypothetical protein
MYAAYVGSMRRDGFRMLSRWAELLEQVGQVPVDVGEGDGGVLASGPAPQGVVGQQRLVRRPLPAPAPDAQTAEAVQDDVAVRRSGSGITDTLLVPAEVRSAST